MAEVALVVVFGLVALAAPLVLYALVRAEHDQRQEMDRATAEQVARRDTDQVARRDTDRDES